MRRMNLTDPAVRNLPFATVKDGPRGYPVRDKQVSGLVLRVRQNRKSFFFERDTTKTTKVNDTTKVKKRIVEAKRLGVWSEHGPMSVEQARDAAVLEARGSLNGDRAPAIETRPPVTFAVGFERYIEEKGCSAGTLKTYRSLFKNLPDETKATPVAQLDADIDGKKVLHRKITTDRGPSIANLTIDVVNAVCKFILNPTVKKNPKTRRDTAIPFDRFPEWAQQVEALRVKHPIKASFHMLTLLTGSRPDALRTSLDTDFDREAHTWTLKVMKGGKPLTIPTTPAIEDELERLQAAADVKYERSLYIFPGSTGHLVKYEEDRTVLFAYGGDLRQSYITVAADLDVDEVKRRLLVGHSLKGINQGYITKVLLEGSSTLRKEQERISKRLVELMRG